MQHEEQARLDPTLRGNTSLTRITHAAIVQATRDARSRCVGADAHPDHSAWHSLLLVMLSRRRAGVFLIYFTAATSIWMRATLLD